MNTEDKQPELRDIKEAIRRYVAVNGNRVDMFASFLAEDVDGQVIPEKSDVFAFGKKNKVIFQLQTLGVTISKVRGPFISNI